MGKKSNQSFHFEIPFMSLQQWQNYLFSISKAFEEQTQKEIGIVFVTSNALLTVGKLGKKISQVPSVSNVRKEKEEKKRKEKKKKKKKKEKKEKVQSQKKIGHAEWRMSCQVSNVPDPYYDSSIEEDVLKVLHDAQKW